MHWLMLTVYVAATLVTVWVVWQGHLYRAEKEREATAAWVSGRSPIQGRVLAIRKPWCKVCRCYGHKKWLFLGTHWTHRRYIIHKIKKARREARRLK